MEGRLQTRKWQDQNGNDRYTTEIVANELKSLTPKGEGEGVGSSSSSHDDPENSSNVGNGSSSMPLENKDVPF